MTLAYYLYRRKPNNEINVFLTIFLNCLFFHLNHILDNYIHIVTLNRKLFQFYLKFHISCPELIFGNAARARLACCKFPRKILPLFLSWMYGA